VVESRVSEDRGAAEVVWRHAGENIVSNRVPSDETRTAPDKPEQHRVVRLSFECSSGDRTPDVPGFSSGKITIRPQRSVREVPVQASVKAFNAARSRLP